MGNYCSSGQKKKQKDNASEKSEESPSYQIADKTKKSNNAKEAPLAAPEPLSDVTAASSQDGGHHDAAHKGTIKIVQSVGDSETNSPLALSPPCELIPSQNLHPNLSSLYGKPTTNRRTEKDKKIVLYILSPDDGYQIEKEILHQVYKRLFEKCASRDFEIYLSDLHVSDKGGSLNVKNWLEGPLEAQGGHGLAANCLAEISRHSKQAYLIPILFLSSTLGESLLPLTIEHQDFDTALKTAEIESEANRNLLEKWYKLDNKSVPACYRLRTSGVKESAEDLDELNRLMNILVEIFSKELRDSYLTTVVEQEINNTVLINTELSKRCLWIQNSVQPPKVTEASTPLEIETNRRLYNIQNDLRNQLTDKHIIRIPPSIAQQQDQFATVLETLITAEVGAIIDEHLNKFTIPHCTYGVDRRLLLELEEIDYHSRILNENCANFAIIDDVRKYVTSNSVRPLIVYGKPGCGKSVLTAKIAQSVHNWLPECGLVLRYVGLTQMSADLASILGSIVEQVAVLTTGSSPFIYHDSKTYADHLAQLLSKTKQKIIILVDSVNDIVDLKNVDWLPMTFPENIKIILTLTSTAIGVTNIKKTEAQNWLLATLSDKINNDSQFIHLPAFSAEQWCDVLSSGGGDLYAASGALLLPDKWKELDEKNPMLAKLLWWLAWIGIKSLDEISVQTISRRVFEILEEKFGQTMSQAILSLIIASRTGLLESEIVALISQEQLVEGSPEKMWANFCWYMGPLLLHNKHTTFMDKTVREVGLQKYKDQVQKSHNTLETYFSQQPDVLTDKSGKSKCFNTRKFIELPYQAYHLDSVNFAASRYLTDLTWIYNKINAAGCVHLLNDINLLGQNNVLDDHLLMLRTFLQQNFRALNYDTQQTYSLLTNFIKRDGTYASNSVVQQWQQTMDKANVTCLERIGVTDDSQEKVDGGQTLGYDLIMNLRGNFVVTLNTQREEICVWDVARCTKVRTLKGVPQPSALCPVGDHGVAVLCRREIRVIDLDNGKFKVTLKGVMNQKMPYFGLHDSSHLVCLSRNRMYVNLMNLESGDCVTTFKAGEDRFLNSLLVSGDGRILVCGDETQKPFPLLVWHLSQRKLLYDLRIPHHDFITSLSAITHEGSYVSVVAKELSEPTPNFIVVYDLQSGTLFKKWKPSCNTVSLAISQTNTCVVAGLEDSRILIWDLVTGNCRCSLIGHCAPVTLLKLDPLGKVLLSGDKEGRDRSIRLWNLDHGQPLAVYTCKEKIGTSEILSGGQYVVLAIENSSRLMTLKLCGVDANAKDSPHANETYGNRENDGKIFDLNE